MDDAAWAEPSSTSSSSHCWYVCANTLSIAARRKRSPSRNAITTDTSGSAERRIERAHWIASQVAVDGGTMWPCSAEMLHRAARRRRLVHVEPDDAFHHVERVGEVGACPERHEVGAGDQGRQVDDDSRSLRTRVIADEAIRHEEAPASTRRRSASRISTAMNAGLWRPRGSSTTLSSSVSLG